MIGKRLHRGLESEDVASLIEAHDWLSGLADRDCDCDWNQDASQCDNPCDVCQARYAMDALAKVIDPIPRTLQPERLKNAPEKIYFELWCEENKRLRHVNGGYTLIEHLLCPESNPADSITKRPRPAVVSQHDMTIATTVIQWLGTNCGNCFIRNAEREIEKRRAERSKFLIDGISSTPEAWKARQEEGDVFRVADSIASQFVSDQKRSSVHKCLRLAIINAITQFTQKTSRQHSRSSEGQR